MKILFLTTPGFEHLADGLLYGLRHLLGGDVVDWPKKGLLYHENAGRLDASREHGMGFGLFGLRDDPADRTELAEKLNAGYFDLVVNSSCWRITCPNHPRLVAVDGEDHPNLNNVYLRTAARYFKDEIAEPDPRIHPTAFSLPDHLAPSILRPEKSVELLSSFMIATPMPWEESCRHQRVELARRYPPKLFKREEEYLDAIERAWFTLSPKGFGYDCPRHYEVIGRSIPLIELGPNAAYHLRENFVDGVNCVTFETPEELEAKLKGPIDRDTLLANGREDLFKKHLSSRRAEQFLAACRGVERNPATTGSLSMMAWREFLSPVRVSAAAT